MDLRDDDDAGSRVRERLLPGERIVWLGRPDPGVIFGKSDAYLIPFSVIWIFLVGELWFTSGRVGSAPTSGQVVFDAMSTVFAIFGLYYVFGRFIYKAWHKRRTTYAITSSRALILSGPRNVRELPAAGTEVTSEVARNGSHESVTFGPPQRWGIFTQRNRYPNSGLDPLYFFSKPQFAFYDVADVDGLNAALAQSREVPKDRVSND